MTWILSQDPKGGRKKLTPQVSSYLHLCVWYARVCMHADNECNIIFIDIMLQSQSMTRNIDFSHFLEIKIFVFQNTKKREACLVKCTWNLNTRQKINVHNISRILRMQKEEDKFNFQISNNLNEHFAKREFTNGK